MTIVKTGYFWVIYRESDAVNVAVLKTSEEVTAWMDEFLTEVDKDDYFAEAVNSYEVNND
jgi:hypothetical protein